MWVAVITQSLCLAYCIALDLNRYRMSKFELRSINTGATDLQNRMLKKVHKYVAEISTLRRIVIAVLTVLITGFLVYLEQSLVGIVYTLILITVLLLATRLSIIKNIATAIFEKNYEFICSTAKRLSAVLRFIEPRNTTEHILRSKAELIDTIQTLPSTVLLPAQRHRVETVLQADEKVVEDIMTPKKRVVMVEPSAVLGPIVLSDLQKSGHGYFPVATKKGEPEGILALSTVADLEVAKQRNTIRELMSTHIAWVEEGTSLSELARLALVEKQYILLVRNTNNNFSGLVTISDIMKHLVGIVKV